MTDNPFSAYAHTRDNWPEAAKFKFGASVSTPREPFWRGFICGWYINSNGRFGYNVESYAIKGAIHNYPETGLVPYNFVDASAIDIPYGASATTAARPNRPVTTDVGDGKEAIVTGPDTSESLPNFS